MQHTEVVEESAKVALPLQAVSLLEQAIQVVLYEQGTFLKPFHEDANHTPFDMLILIATLNVR